jgi:hypothetical protein
METIAESLRRRVLRDQQARADGVPDVIRANDRENTAWLRQVIRQHGWPGLRLVGDQGGKDAWLLALHADADLAFQREALDLLIEAVDQGDAPAWQVAYLADRVLLHRGRPQRYGTQFQRVDGEWQPIRVEDPDAIDRRRTQLGLPPFAEAGVSELPPRLRSGRS